MRRGWSLGLLTGVLAAVGLPAGTAAATNVTLGPSLELPSVESFSLQGDVETLPRVLLVNTAPGQGTTLLAPADGTVTSWGLVASAQHGNVKLQVLTPGHGKGTTFEEARTTFENHGASSAALHLNGTPNPTSIPITVGDTLGLLLSRESANEPGDHVEVLDAAQGGAGFQYTFNYTGQEAVELTEPILGLSLLYDATIELTPPSITAMSPNAGIAGSDVTITGRHLAKVTAVTFGGVPATGLFAGADDSHITAIVPPGPAGATVAVQVTTAGGTSDAELPSLFTYPTEPSRTPPTISALRLAPSSFRAAGTGGTFSARHAGSRVSYRVSQAATTTFTIQRILQGRRSGKRCVAATRRNHRAHGCTRLLALTGDFQRDDTGAGTDSFKFSGRLNGRALAPGNYRLKAVAGDAAGDRSKPAMSAFSVLRSPS